MFENLSAAYSLVITMKMMCDPQKKYINMWEVVLPGAVSFHFYIFLFFPYLKCFAFTIKKNP